MQRILIVGGGGFGRELHGYLRADLDAGHRPGFTLGGVIDNKPDCELARCAPDLPYLGALEDYQPQPADRFIVAVGSVASRLTMSRQLAERDVELFTYIHPTALVAADARIDAGAIICPYAIVNSGAHIAEHVAVNVFCSIGHGARVGACSVLSPYAALNGNASIGARGFLGTRATVFPGVQLGDSCIVDSHSFVKASVPDRKIVSSRGQYLVVDNRLGA